MNTCYKVIRFNTIVEQSWVSAIVDWHKSLLIIVPIQMKYKYICVLTHITIKQLIIECHQYEEKRKQRIIQICLECKEI